jgi:hypothetical protein
VLCENPRETIEDRQKQLSYESSTQRKPTSNKTFQFSVLWQITQVIIKTKDNGSACAIQSQELIEIGQDTPRVYLGVQMVPN